MATALPVTFSYSDRAMLLRIAADQQEILGGIDELRTRLDTLEQNGVQMSDQMTAINQALADATVKLSAETDAVTRAIGLLDDLKTQVDALGSLTDLSQIKSGLEALGTGIDANKQAIAEALMRDTPPQPTA